MNYVDTFLKKLKNVKKISSGWLASCPCLDHGGDGADNKPSLSIRIGNEGRILLNCFAGCSYHSILSSLKVNHLQLRPDSFLGEQPHDPTIDLGTQDHTPTDLAEVTDRIYRDFINLLPLHEDHVKDLSSRGLSFPHPETLGFRSLRQSDLPPIIQSLHKKYGDVLLHVPGFVEVDGHCKLKSEILTGLLIPVRDLNGKIVALKVRQNSGEFKYCYISSVPNGRGPGTPVHCPLGKKLNTDLIRITEGELKAEVATSFSGVYTLGLAGVNSWQKSLEVISALAPHDILLSFDWIDVISKKAVRDSLLQFMKVLRNNGYTLGVEYWDTKFKGIDDALFHEDSIQEVWSNPEEFIEQSVQGAQAKGDWVPLPFPVEVFPTPIQGFIQTVSESLPCPPDFVSLPALVVAGVMLGGSHKIKVKEGWTEQANIYGAIVGSPGTIKTPSLMKAMAPVFQLQKEMVEHYEADHLAWKTEKMIFKAQESSYKAALKKYLVAFPSGKPEDCDVDPPKALRPEPVIEHIVTDDFTLESLAPMLRDSDIVSWADELVGKIAAMNAYRGGKGDDRQKYLSLWSGNSIKVDRKSTQGSITVDKPFFSMIGGIQPDLLGTLEDKQGRSDGFIDRLLFSYPIADPVPDFTEPGINPEFTQKWMQLCRTLRAYALKKNEDGTEESYTLTYSSEAMNVFRSWYKEHKKQTEDPNFPSAFLGYWSKLKAYLVRFSLILFMMKRGCQDLGWIEGVLSNPEEIDIESIQNAVKLIDYFKDHYKGVWTKFLFDADEWRIEDFIKWIKDNNNQACIKDIYYQNNRWRIKTKSEAKRFLDKMVDRGYGIITKDTGIEVFHLVKTED